VPDLPFDVFEKLDGSLIIIFHHAGRWRAATKGDFASAQALWAQARLDAQDLSALVPGTTYLAEAVYPENRVIVRYAEPALVLLGAYTEAGEEAETDALAMVAGRLGWRLPERHSFSSISDLILHARALPREQEGFVLRFADGTRLKVKGDEYRRLHALISRVTPLAVWEAIANGDDLVAIRRDLPEEFWSDFDAIVRSLEREQNDLLTRIAGVAQSVASLSDKELGLNLGTLDPELRGFVFTYRKTGGDLLKTDRARQSVLRAIRPTGNMLAGYVPSYAMIRVLEETG
jgi:RNA ligase